MAQIPDFVEVVLDFELAHLGIRDLAAFKLNDLFNCGQEVILDLNAEQIGVFVWLQSRLDDVAVLLLEGGQYGLTVDVLKCK